MSLSLRLSPDACADLDDIADYTLREWGVAQTVEYVGALNAAIEALLDEPGKGKKRSDLGDRIRSIPAQRHLIYYEVSGGHLDILRVLHASRDATLQMAGKP